MTIEDSGTPPVAAPTPETPSNPVGPINGAQTMSFTPVPDHPTPETPSHWQPIETARKDGFIVLLAEFGRSGSRNFYVGHFASKTGGRKHWLTIPGAWERNPTHWMPLPDPPLAGAVSHPQPDPKTTNDDEVARVDGRGLPEGFGTAGSDAGAQGDSAETIERCATVADAMVSGPWGGPHEAITASSLARLIARAIRDLKDR